MRPLQYYTTREWLRVKPLDHLLIQVGNDILQRVFRGLRPGRLRGFLQDVAPLSGRNIGLVIAFEKPWVLDWLLKMAARNVSDGDFLVFDNSRGKEARREIEAVCRKNGTPYLPLPFSPTRHPNRSHGMAMTWVFHNVVRAIEPRTFTFIDHDLIPMEKVCLGSIPKDQPFYGPRKVGKWGWWTLWAGYCAYYFSAVRELPLNFLNDFSRDLDTGGRNWPVFYRHHDREGLLFGKRERFEFIDPLDNSATSYQAQIVDAGWMHLGGAGHRDKFREHFDFYQRLARATEDGLRLQDLIKKP